MLYNRWTPIENAGVAKLVDATALGAVGSNPVEVQVLSPAQNDNFPLIL